MKALLLSLLLAAAALATGGCEINGQTDNSSFTIQDGAVTQFETRQGNIIITSPASTNTTFLSR